MARDLIGAGVLLILTASAGLAQEMPVPVDVQFSLFYRIISYDRDVAARTAEGLVIGVAYQGGFRASALAKNEAVRQQPPAGAGYAVRFVTIDLDEVADLATAAQQAGCEVLYVAPLRAVRTSAITAVSHARGILTLTGVPEYVEHGIAVGIGAIDERPEILINLAGARAEGAAFSAQLLRLARVW